MIIQATIPDYLMRHAAEVTERENTTVDSIIAIALSSQVTAWQVRDSVEARETGCLLRPGSGSRRRPGCSAHSRG